MTDTATDKSPARRAGVVGWPISHSRSPILHGYWLKKYHISGSYEPIPIAPERFEEEFRALAAHGYAGVNVTVPHKAAAARLCDELDDNARRLGAVNTVVIGPNGHFSGSNSDGFGFMENIRQGAPEWLPQAGPAVVIGAGGAARAIVAALLDAGVPEVRLCNRTQARADTLAVEIGGAIKVRAWEERADLLCQAGLLVNCSSLGMVGQPPLEIDLSQLPVAALVTDIVYTPLQTDLLAQAAARGNRVVDGLGMLLHQARPGFAAWFGVQPEVDKQLRDLVLADIRSEGQGKD